MAQTDAIIFESAFAQVAYRRLIAEPRCPAPVIHNGLTEAEFVPVTPRPDAADFLFIGEFRPVKGIEYLLAALKDIKFQGVAYAAPEAFDAKGDNIAAVIYVNDVDGERFREIDQIGGR